MFGKGTYKSLPRNYIRSKINPWDFLQKVHCNVSCGGFGDHSWRGDEDDEVVGVPTVVGLLDPDSSAEGAGDRGNPGEKVHPSWGFGKGSILTIGGEEV